ncbi:unnamed protein product [Ectocarpus sp. CCAP 1310/34]|nr:unnamed protein product [Ectocarpus sp. CCAP 1310/34]
MFVCGMKFQSVTVTPSKLTLQDLMKNTAIVGGNIFLLSGDFRQIGTVIKYGGPAEIIDASLIPSLLWSSDAFVIDNTDSFEVLIHFVYPDILDADPTSFKTRATMSSTNDTIDPLNEHVLDILPGDLTAYSCDNVDQYANDELDFVTSADLNTFNIADSALSSPPLPPHYAQFIGFTLEGVSNGTHADQDVQTQPRHPNQHVDGGIEAEGTPIRAKRRHPHQNADGEWIEAKGSRT